MTSPANESTAPIVGIDIGGTKTHLRAIGPDGAVHDHIVPSREWRTRDWGEDAGRLMAMVAAFAGPGVAAIGVGAHGCDDGDECIAFQSAFEARTEIPVSVVNDAELMPLALGLAGQIGVVAGTGSIAVCRRDGAMMVAGGWGWIIGDEGSSAGLVREAARAVARHLDAGGSLDEPLVQRLFAGLGVPAAPRLGSIVAAFATATDAGRHAALVFEAAEAGSSLASRVIREGGEALAVLVQNLVECGAKADTVVAGGSVIVAQPLLWQAFSEAVTGLLGTAITPRLFTGKPVEGACHLAATLVSPRFAAAAGAADAARH